MQTADAGFVVWLNLLCRPAQVSFFGDVPYMALYALEKCDRF